MALKVGVVGMSEIGNNHANCHANDDLAELVAVCDIMKEACGHRSGASRCKGIL